ncbi:MAG: YraN family protein [Clostridiales bacterium]|nr:YraN family protein [Clostridiales bacterium]
MPISQAKFLNKNTMNKREKGFLGESIAQKYLKKQGYKIVETNYHASKFAEIDIIAKHKDYLVFIEVKMRFSTVKGYGREAVTVKKQQNIRFAAQHYLIYKIKQDVPVRFDVLEITSLGDVPEIQLIQNAF